VKKIHFNGGEPLLNDDQLGLLLKLEKQDVLKNVFISYNTNGTVMPSKKNY
jgi:molybdenum cofactor biosynthesis enzyme MoaA